MSSALRIRKHEPPWAQRSLHIAHVNAESGFSGGEHQLFLLMEGLRRRGHRNLLVCRPGSRVEAEGRARSVDTRPVPMKSDADLPSVLALRRALRSSEVDLAHLHTARATWLGGLAARLAGVPAITTRRMDRRVKRRSRPVHTLLVQRTVAISPAVVEHLVAAGLGPGRTRTIPSAVDPSALCPKRARSAVRAAEGLAPDAPLLLVLAALVRRKGVDVLLEALTRLAAEGLRPALWVAGEGPERGALERRSEALGLAPRVRLLGQRGDVADLLAACDVVVLPSRREGLGVAALEAAAAGRPVVASRVGGLLEVVEDRRTGLLVPPEDPTALANALHCLLRDDALRARLGRTGAARIGKRFGVDAMTDAYEHLYREVLGKGEPR